MAKKKRSKNRVKRTTVDLKSARPSPEEQKAALARLKKATDNGGMSN